MCLLQERSFAEDLGSTRVEHLLHERQASVIGREGSHWLARVLGDVERVEARHDQALRGGDEANDAEHRKAAVVDLGKQALGLTLRRRLRGEAEGIEEVEWNRVRHLALELRVVAGLAAAHIVLLAIRRKEDGRLAAQLQEANGKDDLQLGRRWQRIPLIAGTACCRNLRVGEGRDAMVRRHALDVARPVDAVSLHHVTHKGSHRNAAVLDLSVAEPPNSLLAHVADAERVVITENGIELVSKLLEASLVRDLAARPWLLGRRVDLEV
mmetsp:Transcript_11492/g.29429  ORF Transcript_11492/g.29429 Transcript_11492/m.29429 type:complete len:268 (-) Transcript_11492:151-954(-)